MSLPSRLVAAAARCPGGRGAVARGERRNRGSHCEPVPQRHTLGQPGIGRHSVGQLFTPGTGFWALAGNVTQPVFQGGTLLHRQRGPRRPYEAPAQYRGTVLTAFQNVADALHAIQCDADALKAAVAAERAAARSLAISPHPA